MPRKPGLRSTSPRRYEALIAARDILLVFVAEGRITRRTLGECWECPVSHVQEKLAGDRPITLGEILLLPDNLSLAVLAESSATVRQRRPSRLAHR